MKYILVEFTNYCNPRPKTKISIYSGETLQY